ncbi:MAG: RNA-binding protein, partial [Geminicoccaceae bacterium]|nr:RNA-binding protein [Geminicoccaceae bacterium]
MAEWSGLKARNPGAKLVCIDIQSYGTTQARNGPEVMNVGGFTDAVFDAMARFVSGETRDWVEIVKEVEV